jgi:hypothetical protein
MKNYLYTTFITGFFFAGNQVQGSSLFYHVDHYRSRQDSPFVAGLQQGTMFLENFENIGPDRYPYNFMTTPNAQGWNGLRSGSPLGGVQEDISSNGIGYYWSSSAQSSISNQLPNGIHFNFTADEQGRFPEYVGAALVGRGLKATGPNFNVILVYDRNGVEITNGAWQIPKPNYDIPYLEEDLFNNFEGIYVPGGISMIHFRDFLEVDHLTYGYSIPEPTVTLLAPAAGLLCLRRKRKLIP